jgi:UDP-4-amino-4,6-dideoxy-N-acetyl-beta-L-altrosamine transaminase
MKMIPYGRQNISDEDIKAVVDVLKSDFLTQGPKVPEFEQKISDLCQAHFAIAVNSATSALHIACLALGVQQDDLVWTSPVSFVASSNCALYCGAKVDFVDIDLSSGNISAQSLKEKLEQAKHTQQLPKVLIAVHLAGQPCDMKEIYELASAYDIKVIEDASHAIGARYLGSPVGNCQFSDITIFSFHPVKIITSAEGGMALTNCPSLSKKLKLLRSHGIVSAPEELTEPSHGPWYYQQIDLGFNYRMTELQAALGLSQLSRLSQFVEKRNALAHRYDEAFKDTSLTLLTPNSDKYSSYHLYIILLPFDCASRHKETVISLRQMNICGHVHYIPIHLQPFYQNMGFESGDFPNAEQYYLNAISIPLYPDLTEENQNYIIESVKSLL